MGEIHCIVTDGYDRDVFARVLQRDGVVATSLARAQRILHQAEALYCDLFGALYKLNVELRPADALSPTVLLNRRLVESLLGGRTLSGLRERTQLDAERSAAALAVLADRLLGALLSEYRVGPESLGELGALADAERALDQRRREREHLEEIPADQLSDQARAELEGGLDAEITRLEGELERGRARQAKAASRLSSEIEDALDLKASQLGKQLDEVDAHLAGLGIGAAGRVGAERRLELGDRLMRSKKLQLLARLTGAMREVALEARKKRLSRAPEELHAITRGADLLRLLPSELLGLDPRRGALHRDFLRRFAEAELGQYELQASSERGPMVVCVDGSGSMHGSKEIWAKAVALTLMEIARREKRRCLALIFSDGDALFETELLSRRGPGRMRPLVRDEQVLRFAEHFPGGGTNFEAPLRRALDAVASGSLRRGDVVFITDGEAQVSDALVAELAVKKKRHHFAIRSILVDAGASSLDTLARFSDDVRKVSDLAGEALGDLFRAV